MSLIVAQLGLVLSLVAAIDAKVSYDGYCLMNITANKQDQVEFLNALRSQQDEPKIRFWHDPIVSHSVEVLVSPDFVASFRQELESQNIAFDIQTNNIQSQIDSENVKLRSNVRFKYLQDSQLPTSRALSNYLNMEEVYTLMNQLTSQYPDFVQTEVIGKTHENRSITVIKVGKGGPNKPGIWIDAGIHAREWIAPSTALYFLNTLISQYKRDAQITNYVENLTWYILPVVNPDGYAYTHDEDRMWRKNRKQPTSGRCGGVDLNRNFAYNWGGSGASANPCDETYRGPAACSEPECIAVSNYITLHSDTIKAFFTMHSYSQMWFYPFGDRSRSYPKDKIELEALSKKATDALRAVHGTRYKVGTAADILYPSSGGSDDWAKGKAGIKYVFGLELRPGENDVRTGFILPASQIVSTGEETWAAVRVVADQVLAKYGNSMLMDQANASGGSSGGAPTAQSLLSQIIAFLKGLFGK